jgi:hypothetical protein
LFFVGGAFLVYPYSAIVSLGVFVSGFVVELVWTAFLAVED